MLVFFCRMHTIRLAHSRRNTALHHLLGMSMAALVMQRNIYSLLTITRYLKGLIDLTSLTAFGMIVADRPTMQQGSAMHRVYKSKLTEFGYLVQVNTLYHRLASPFRQKTVYLMRAKR